MRPLCINSMMFLPSKPTVDPIFNVFMVYDNSIQYWTYDTLCFDNYATRQISSDLQHRKFCWDACHYVLDFQVLFHRTSYPCCLISSMTTRSTGLENCNQTILSSVSLLVILMAMWMRLPSHLAMTICLLAQVLAISKYGIWSISNRSVRYCVNCVLCMPY